MSRNHYLQDAFHLRNALLGASNSCADTLCAVHSTAAAESNDCVAVVVMIHFETVFDVLNGRIGDDVVIAATLHALCFACSHDGICLSA